MKLRIQDNSLRLRLTRQEVEDLNGGAMVERAIQFTDRGALIYSVSGSADAATPSVIYTGNAVRVTLPQAIVRSWATTGEVTIEGTDGLVHLLVEKDFQCLHQPEGPDPEAFPNPLA